MFHSLSPTLHPILFPSTTLYSILVYNLSSALLRRCYRSVFSVVQTFSLPLQLNTSRCNHTSDAMCSLLRSSSNNAYASQHLLRLELANLAKFSTFEGFLRSVHSSPFVHNHAREYSQHPSCIVYTRISTHTHHSSLLLDVQPVSSEFDYLPTPSPLPAQPELCNGPDQLITRLYRLPPPLIHLMNSPHPLVPLLFLLHHDRDGTRSTTY